MSREFTLFRFDVDESTVRRLLRVVPGVRPLTRRAGGDEAASDESDLDHATGRQSDGGPSLLRRVLGWLTLALGLGLIAVAIYWSIRRWRGDSDDGGIRPRGDDGDDGGGGGVTGPGDEEDEDEGEEEATRIEIEPIVGLAFLIGTDAAVDRLRTDPGPAADR